MVHEHPGVYSSYDASSVIGGKKTARILGAAAVSTTGTANAVVTLTSYAEGVSAFGEDAEGTVGMAALPAALSRTGAAAVKAVPVASFVILVLLWVSSRNLSVDISLLIGFPVIYADVLAGLVSTAPRLVEMARVYLVHFRLHRTTGYVSQVPPVRRSVLSLAV